MRIVVLLLLLFILDVAPLATAGASQPPKPPGQGLAPAPAREAEPSQRRCLNRDIACAVAMVAGFAIAGVLVLRRLVRSRTEELMEEVQLRSQRERELEREKRFVEAVIESLPVLFYLHDGQQFLRWNSTFQEVIGRPAEELSSLHPLSVIHRDDWGITYRKRAEILDSGGAQWEARFVTSGESRHYHLTGKRMELDGSVYIVGTAADITERKLAELALRESERRFGEMLENLRLIAIMIDTNDRVTFCNDFLLELTGWRRSDVLGRNWFEMFYPDPAESRRTFHEAIGHGIPYLHREKTILTHGGARRVISWNSTVLRSPEGEEIGVASIGVDITDSRQYQNALQRILAGVSTATGRAFFQSLVMHLAQALELDYAIISEPQRDVAGKMRTVAVCAGSEAADNFSYDMAGTPCQELQCGDAVVIERGLRGLYPEVGFFAEKELESYAAVPLRNAAGEFLGALVVLGRQPLASRELVEAMLGIFAERAAAEIERTRAEQALKEREEKYRLLFDKMLNGYVVCEVICRDGKAVDYRFLEVNASYETLAGLTREELIGRSVRELVPDIEELWIERFGAVALSEESDQFEAHSAAMGKWLKVAAYSPQPGRFAATFSDISNRKLAEEALRESEEHVRQIFRQSDDALMLYNRETFNLLEANPAALQLFGASREELKMLKPWGVIGPADFRKIVRVLSREERGGFRLDRATCHRADGSSFPAAIRGKMLMLRSEYVILCSVRDITAKARMEDEMKATQAKLIQANKMTSLGMLVSAMAHEINNPNNFISVNSLMLTEIWRDVAPILRDFRDRNGDFQLGGLPFSEMESVVPRLMSGITEGASRIASIVSNMRNFVRKEEGGTGRLIDVNRAIDNAASLLWHHIQRHTDSFAISLGEGLPYAGGSSQQIEQVIINLIMNALQALPSKECAVRVKSGLEPESGMLAISVADEGYGMNKKVRKRLTEPFFSTKIDRGGTGLGLYISSSIIKEHNGTLSFESAPGKGTTATIRLPRAGSACHSPASSTL